MDSSSVGLARRDPVDEVRRFAFHGDGGKLFGIVVTNILLTLVTLGFYRFWGRCRVRRYLWSQTEFEGDRFMYHGTGRELMRGFAKAMLIFGVPFLVANLLPLLGGLAWVVAGQVLTSVIGLVFAGVGMVGARRYRLSRTSWRAIRFSFRGGVRAYMGILLKGSLLTALTLGFYAPVFKTERHRFMVAHSYFGNRRFGFDGAGKALIGPYVVALLLTLPTLGISWLWYAARCHRYFWEHTSFDTARFRPSFTPGQLVTLWLGNLLLILGTLGLGFAWATARTARFLCTGLVLEGPLDLAGIEQDAQAVSATGEAIADFLDLGFDFG